MLLGRGEECGGGECDGLCELGRTPVMVVSAGANKSILDILRTLEFLETQSHSANVAASNLVARAASPEMVPLLRFLTAVTACSNGARLCIARGGRSLLTVR